MIFFRKTRRELQRQRLELNEERRLVEKARRRSEKQPQDVEEGRATLELLVRDRVAGYDHIAQAWADWERLRADHAASYLRSKMHPARKAAGVVREIGVEMAELRRRMKTAEYVTALYEFHFPWLVEFRDVEEEIAYVAAGESDEERVRTDAASRSWHRAGRAPR